MRRLRSYVLAAVAVSLCHCANNDIVLDVAEIPSSASRLEVQVFLDGREAKTILIEPARPQFALNLPDGMEGHLAVAVTGIDSRGCWVSVGRGEVDFRFGGCRPTYVTVSQEPTSQCPLTVTKVGAGRILSTPPGIDCSHSPCQAMMPSGVPINLTVAPVPSDYLATWTGACSVVNQNSCTFQMPGPASVSVDLHPLFCKTAACWVDSGSAVVTKDLFSVWGSSESNIWVVDVDGAAPHFDGTAWTRLPMTAVPMRSVWGISANDIWAVGGAGSRYHNAGSLTWTQTTDSHLSYLYAVWGSSPEDIWAAGEGTEVLLHYQARTWSQLSVPVASLYGLSGTSAKDVFAVGTGGTILHFDGTTWTAQTSNTSNTLRGVWAESPTSVWAVGESGTVLHYDGARWTPKLPGYSQPLWAVWGSSSQDVWVVGGFKRISHYDGTGWTHVSFDAAGPNLYGLWGSSSRSIWAVGAKGTILHYQP